MNNKPIPRIEISPERKLVGKRLAMNFAAYKVAELWKDFIPKRYHIKDAATSDLISMVIYTPSHFANFSVNNEFEKWAAVEVKNFNEVPNGMETFALESSLYAVFDYKGLNTDPSIYQYIFGTWLPSSAYVLDNRPHFEVLGDKYKDNDPNSEEEIWIPIKAKV